jgi:Holliday junction DNA helicase RuvA
MLEYLKGEIIELNPTFLILENNGTGYFIKISLNSFSAITNEKNIKIFIHEVIREDVYELYGFITAQEREVYRKLISVSGVGPNTALIMISSLTTSDIITAISTGDTNTIKSVKGIGLKTAQRIIVDLKDKIGTNSENFELFANKDNTIKEEALSALIMLGFNKKLAEKAVETVTKENKGVEIEGVIKAALKLL